MTNTNSKFLALGAGLALGVGILTAAACLPEQEVTPTPGYEHPDMPGVIQEDDPVFDCRTMGNMICGVEVEGTWYILDFKTGTFTEREVQ